MFKGAGGHGVRCQRQTECQGGGEEELGLSWSKRLLSSPGGCRTLELGGMFSLRAGSGRALGSGCAGGAAAAAQNGRRFPGTPVFLPGESYGQRSLAGYSPWGHKESDIRGSQAPRRAVCGTRATLCDPVDGSPPGSPIPGILQESVLEWVAISFSNACTFSLTGQDRVPPPF